MTPEPVPALEPILGGVGLSELAAPMLAFGPAVDILKSQELPWRLASPAWLAAAALLAWLIWALRREAELTGAAFDRRRLVAGAGAAAVLVAAFVSPIGPLADGVLFSAHMVQHLLMLLAFPLLLLRALPALLTARAFEHPALRPVRRVLATPLAGWLLALGAMWAWHVPAACTAGLTSPVVGLLRDASFVLAGTAFWWPVAAPLPEDRLPAPLGVTYLFAACLGCTVLGIMITFTPLTVCPAFAHASPQLPLLGRLRAAGFTPAVDQELGGLLMWVPPCVLYAAVSVRALARWYAAPSEAAAVRGAAEGAEIS